MDHYTQTAAVYFTVFDEFVFNLKRQINRNSEGQAHKAAGSREDLRVNADDFSLHIEKRTAGVARVDGGVSLNERDKLIAWEVTALSRDDTARYCVLQTKGSADSSNPLAYFDIFRVAELNARKVFPIDLNDSNVCFGITADNFGIELTIISQMDLDFISAVNNVMVSKNQTVRTNNEAGALAFAFWHTTFKTIRSGEGERESETTELIELVFGHSFERVCVFTYSGFLSNLNTYDCFTVVLHKLGEVRQLRLLSVSGGYRSNRRCLD